MVDMNQNEYTSEIEHGRISFNKLKKHIYSIYLERLITRISLSPVSDFLKKHFGVYFGAW